MIELPPLTRVALASGIELDTVDAGPRDGPALIFLHGFPESHRTWRHQIAHLANRFRCIAPDQRGYRGSSKPQDVASYTADKLVGDVFQLADALKLRDFAIVGHDWGGAIAWGVAVAGQLSGRVTRAIIANAPHPAVFQKLLWTDPGQRAASQYIRGLRDHAVDPLVRAHGLAPVLMKVIGASGLALPEPDERALLIAEWKDPAASFGMLNWYRASQIEVPPLDAPYRAGDDPLAGFPFVAIPTLVVWGMDDPALLPANIEGLDRVAADPTVVRVPRAGHFVPWEAPEAVSQAIEEFLA